MNLIESHEWQALVIHQEKIASQAMRDWFAENPRRFTQFHLIHDELCLDYSRNRIHTETLSLLTQLAQATQLQAKIHALMEGQPVNTTEHRPALHTALRDRNHSPIRVQGEDIATTIQATYIQMKRFVDAIHTQQWKGVSGKAIKHIVNIGIGGSYTGAIMCTQALSSYAHSDLLFHFMTSVDHAHVEEILQKIDPETTLFIIASKSLTTVETLTNARTALTWMQAKLSHSKEAIQAQHFIAITKEIKNAQQLGIPLSNIFPIWDWIGGRYSIWSAMGLPLMLMIGENHFAAFLEGGYHMDQHFKQADFTQNMPVILALLAIWYRNFFGTTVQAMIPYSYRLRYFIPYLQQAEMESNGKRVDLHGHPLPYGTSPVLFGEEGCLGQHAYHQLLHQGQHLIPVDFIVIGDLHQTPNQDLVLASALSQAEALMRGKTHQETFDDLITKGYSKEHAATLAPHLVIPGNKPSNILFLKRITPYNVGALIALYEHKIMAQSAIWNINPFDQWGIELGKQLLPTLLPHVHLYPQKIG